MRRVALALIVTGCVSGCGPAEPQGVEPTEALRVPVQRVKVDHILVAAKNERMPRITRTAIEARTLALELLAKVRAGEDFDKLKETYSDDGDPGQPRGGPYALANDGVAPHAGEMPRRGMVSGFGDVAFGLKVGEIGLAEMDPAASPYGFHIVKRLE